jgi:hypothetical protein
MRKLLIKERAKITFLIFMTLKDSLLIKKERLKWRSLGSVRLPRDLIIAAKPLVGSL